MRAEKENREVQGWGSRCGEETGSPYGKNGLQLSDMGSH